MSGTNNLLMEPEFDDVSKIRTLLNKFEDKDLIKSIKTDDDEIKVYIGSENSMMMMYQLLKRVFTKMVKKERLL